MRTFIVVGVLFLSGCSAGAAPASSPSTLPTRCVSQGGLPDLACQPGAVDTSVTQANIQQTICTAGYTARVRPAVSYTDSLKLEQMKAYGYTGRPSIFEEDHRVPLEAGGNPTSALNLWPEPREASGGAPKGYGAEGKDTLENFIHARICSGKMTLAEGQAVFLGDFFKWRDEHIGKP